jgi:hypothetical protein
MGDKYYKLGGKNGHRVVLTGKYSNRLPHLSNQKIRYDECNGYIVSTVFLEGIPARISLFGKMPQIVFETMIFEGVGEDINYKPVRSWGYSTWKGAIRGHRNAVKLAKLMPDILIVEKILDC